MLETANPIYQPEPVPDVDETVHEPNHNINAMSETYVVGFRNVCFICLIGVVTFFGLRPSRTIRQIIVHKVCRISLNIETKFVNLILRYQMIFLSQQRMLYSDAIDFVGQCQIIIFLTGVKVNASRK